MDNTSWRLLLPGAVLLVLVATVLGLRTAGENVLAADVRVSEWIQRWQGDLPEALEYTGDMLGDTPAAITVVVGALAIAATLRAGRIAVFLIFVGVLRVMGTGLKPLYESPRPVPSGVRIRIYEMAEGFGYPSGHSMTAAMIATIGVVIVLNATRDVRIRWATLVLAIAYTLLVGWSRIWSEAHWPTDVLGGWSYGVALVLFAWAATTLRVGSRSD